MNLNLPAFFFGGLVVTLLCSNTASGNSAPSYGVHVSLIFDDNWLARSGNLQTAKSDLREIFNDAARYFRQSDNNAPKYIFSISEPIKLDDTLEIGTRKGKGIDYVAYEAVKGISKQANIYLFMTDRPSPQDAFVVGASSKIGGVCSEKSSRVALASWYSSKSETALMIANSIGGLMTAGNRECMRCRNPLCF